jgi:glycosyltransferase involved in cell wall biosynthesis
LLTYHNERTLLTECLESLARQSRKPDEVWVYDDASDAPACEYVQTPGLDLGCPVRVIRGENNLGPARGRNLLLRETRADYVHFHDADDLFLPGWGETVAALIEAGRPDCVLTELRSVRDGRPYGEAFLRLHELGDDVVGFMLGHAILPAAGTYRREFVLRSGGYREDLWQSEDYEFHIRLALEGANVRTWREPLVLVRVRGESRSQKRAEVWRCRLAALEMLEPRLVPAHAPALAEAYAETGSVLHRMGEETLARRAFARALRWGRPVYRGQGACYRRVAWIAGPLAAERLGRFYRLCLPQSLRHAVRRHLSPAAL